LTQFSGLLFQATTDIELMSLSRSSSQPTDSQALWCINKPEQLLFERFDSATFCYHKLSGETHVIAAFPDELIQRLQQQATSSSELTRYIASLCEEEVTPQWCQRIENALIELQKLGLVSVIQRQKQEQEQR
jgi:PqqD family protein of HPr-rel-A system